MFSYYQIQYFYKVKFLTLLLSLIVLTLTIVPCCAVEKEDCTEQISVKTAQQTEKNEDCCKDCSPFYVCGTCVGFTISNSLAPTFVIYLRAVKHDSIYLTVELPQIHAVIWQPPQLS
ncbi:DUF6660 family protein [Pedobacter sp. WC2423]|uniref:DUF6660 family protein n=1 Tax=Pedobacter sp. WC2423 TaxID=3234142 RepID=UPI003465DC3D